MSDHFSDRSYVIIPTGSIGWIVFEDVLQTSIDSLRVDVAGTGTFVKYTGTMPASVNSIPGRSDAYDWSQMSNILAGLDWTPTGTGDL
jgi:hypothetical protein